MVKINLSPLGNRVTSLTILIREIFWADLVKVNIFMTINTAFAHIFETPFDTLFMTCNARSCKMGSGQWKNPFIVLLQSVGG